jgi:hypothetical protein
MKCRAITCKKQTGRVNGLCDDRYLMTTIFGESSLKNELLGVIDLEENGYFCTRCKKVTTAGQHVTVQPSECGPIMMLVCPDCKKEMKANNELVGD